MTFMAEVRLMSQSLKRPIVGPKVPESFNVLVKELQGLGLKVDLISSDSLVDAEAMLASSIKDEAMNQSK